MSGTSTCKCQLVDSIDRSTLASNSPEPSVTRFASNDLYFWGHEGFVVFVHHMVNQNQGTLMPHQSPAESVDMWCHPASIKIAFFVCSQTSWPMCKTPSLWPMCTRATPEAERFLWTAIASLISHSKWRPQGPKDWAAWRKRSRLLVESDGKSTWASNKTMSLFLSREGFDHLNKASTTSSSLETFRSSRCRILCNCLALNFWKSSCKAHCWKSQAICSSQACCNSCKPRTTVSGSNCNASWLVNDKARKSDSTEAAKRCSP